MGQSDMEDRLLVSPCPKTEVPVVRILISFCGNRKTLQAAWLGALASKLWDESKQYRNYRVCMGIVEKKMETTIV